MKVALLASGRSKRLKPIEDKNFLEFLGKPLLQHQIERLAQAGFDDFTVVGGAHNLERIGELAKSLPFNISVVEQEDLDDGMAGGASSIQKVYPSGPLLIISATDIVDRAVFKEVAEADEPDVDGYMVAQKVSKYFPGGYLSCDESGLIKEIVEKPGEGNEPGDLVNIVIHRFNDCARLFEALSKTESSNDDRYEVALDKMIKDGFKFKAVPYEGEWHPLKYPWHVFEIMNYFLGGIKGVVNNGAEIAETAIVRGDVVLEKGVKIMDYAIVSGPAYIGENTLVANNALVRGSCVGADCVVGFSTEVARSFLGNNVWTHSNYIGDSIIGNNVSFGSGTVTGNLRLDEGNIAVRIKGEKMCSGCCKFGLITGDRVRVGINTSFMPGVKIGGNSMVGAGISVHEDVESGKFVYGKTELIVKDNTSDLDPVKRSQMKNVLKI